MTGLTRCLGWPRGFRCQSLLAGERYCRTCRQLKAKYPHHPTRALEEQHKMAGADRDRA